MERRKRTLIVMAIAVVTATLATWTVYRALGRIPARQVEVARLQVVIAARAIPIGTAITHADVKLVGWPEASPLAGSFSSPDAVVGRGVVVAVSENEPITEARLAPREAGAGLPPAIGRGMRAISVKVNEVVGVAGFVTPGTRVDVALTVRHGQDVISRLLVTNVQVLTAGTRYDQEAAREGKPIPSTVVTLMVTPLQAERIALASTEGQMTLMLRNPLDIDDPETPGVRLAALVDRVADPGNGADLKAGRSRTEGPRRVASVATQVYQVESIAGGKRTVEVVR
jgi:pilus assembly protein CpaB